jgi:capsular polysaccharide biosynthesis protein
MHFCIREFPLKNEEKEEERRDTMINENRDALEIDLQKLLLAYLNKWWLIVVSTVLAGLAALYISANFITPMYEADVRIYVNNVRSDQYVEYISSSNLATAQRLVNTYIHIIESDTVLEKVAEASGLDVTAKQIRKVMSASQVDDTELFDVTITHADPKVAAHLANAIAEVAPAEIGTFVEGSSTEIIDYAKVPASPSSPNLNRNCILGGLIGCVLALLYLTLRFLMDVRIKDEEDLNMLFEVPVLAQIPAFVPSGSKRGSGYGKNPYEQTETAKKGGDK